MDRGEHRGGDRGEHRGGFHRGQHGGLERGLYIGDPCWNWVMPFGWIYVCD
jgi:hypothetical protein